MPLENQKPLSLMGVPALFCSESMKQLMSVVERVAQTEAAVLISGPSGSGKELVARAVHCYSLRRTNPWVDINCAALPEHLVESELFGYEKGAFSGAESPKLGLFELANRGTLFLDEIAELEPKTQVKLLRVLDGTPYYRVGGLRKIQVDVRIVACTNQNLEEMVESGRFRGDLYHRLSQIHIKVPPLQERPEDIVALAEFFLQGHDARLRFSPCALEALQGYAWPGNVRELRNLVIKLAILNSERLEISAADLPPEIRRTPIAEPDGEPLYRLDALERQMILQALERTGGRRETAAELLGISRRTLSRKLKRYESGTAVQSIGIS